MPSPKIIPACSRIVQQQLLPQIPLRWQHQFKFGVQALTCKPFANLASNARQTVTHPDTASTKMDRLTSNEGLADAFARAVNGLGYVQPTSIVACDHSDFNGLSAFVGAVQTKRGRAIPCLVATTHSPRLPAHGGSKRKQAMRSARRKAGVKLYDQVETVLTAWAKELGFWPRLVFDRGFGGIHLVRTLVEHKATFYVRLKASRRVQLGDTWPLPVRSLAATDTAVRLDDLELRVVRSDDPKTGEPWYILTSDRTSSRDQIVRIYYHRFEIEETFKDIKHVLELEGVSFMKPLSLKVVLWFASLSLILSFLVGWWLQIRKPRHPKKLLSHYRQFFEGLMREAYGPPTDMITSGL